MKYNGKKEYENVEVLISGYNAKNEFVVNKSIIISDFYLCKEFYNNITEIHNRLISELKCQKNIELVSVYSYFKN